MSVMQLLQVACCGGRCVESILTAQELCNAHRRKVLCEIGNVTGSALDHRAHSFDRRLTVGVACVAKYVDYAVST